MMENRMIIIGAGAAGLSAALEFAKNGIKSVLVSDLPSERAQSVMAEGGINAAISPETDSPDQYAEDGVREDSPQLHAQETLKAGRYIAAPKAVRRMTAAAPGIVEGLFADGMAFTLDENRRPAVRAFGGQSVKRTFFAAANTGKQLMYVLIDKVRAYEVEGIIEPYTGWEFLRLLCDSNQAYGCILFHPATKEKKLLHGKVLVMSGGLNGMFGNATGSVRNTGSVAANLFASGVKFANGEFIQYHPTTVRLRLKNMLITEAVRGEGGRLFVLENGRPFYFMEEKYPELGNLMPRDVVSMEEWLLMEQGKQVYLDMGHLEKEVYEKRLKGVLDDCRLFLDLDPKKEAIPVEPGIHYFMGGIRVDANHRTSMKNLYAAGECACQYHGANRLGGNSLLGALYGGKIAAQSAMEDEDRQEALKNSAGQGQQALKNPAGQGQQASENPAGQGQQALKNPAGQGQQALENPAGQGQQALKNPAGQGPADFKNPAAAGSFAENWQRMQSVLKNGLGVIRRAETIQKALADMDELLEKVRREYDTSASEAIKTECDFASAQAVDTGYDTSASETENQALADCLLLGKAMLLSALERKESRGAHRRSDYPEEREEYQKQTIAEYAGGKIQIYFQNVEDQNEMTD